jgi:uncharacterized protein with von Willebrand factor type A (vWA) domain
MVLTDKIENPRRTMVLFYMLDTSGSIDGSKIGAVNTAVKALRSIMLILTLVDCASKPAVSTEQ